MSADGPGLSIITPVYNKAPYLAGCIDSILAQTYRDFELLLIDDRSTDGGLAVCRAYAERDARVRLVELDKNGGAAAARNRGLDEARGEWIGFVDADDTIDPQMYETLLLAAVQSDAQIASCGCMYVHGDGTPDYAAGGRDTIAILTRGQALRCLVSEFPRKEHLEIANWNKVYRRETIGRTRFEHLCSEDYLFNYLVFQTIDRAAAVPAVLYFNNRGDRGSLSRSALSAFKLSSLDANRRVAESLLTHSPELVAPALKRYASVLAGFSIEALSGTRMPYRDVRRYILKHYGFAKQIAELSGDPAAKKALSDRALDIRFPRLHGAVDRMYRAYRRVREVLRGR